MFARMGIVVLLDYGRNICGTIRYESLVLLLVHGDDVAGYCSDMRKNSVLRMGGRNAAFLFVGTPTLTRY